MIRRTFKWLSTPSSSSNWKPGAVPKLTKIVAEPFAPIEFESDTRSQIQSHIQLRAGAVDSLGAIGEAAAPSAGPVIRWGMTIRVVPGHTRSPADPFLIELIAIDVLGKDACRGNSRPLRSGRIGRRPETYRISG